MTKKAYCNNNPAVAYYSGCGGIEIHGISYGIDDYIYCVSGAWNGHKSYHKVKLYFDKNSNAYFMLHGYKIPLSDCIRMGV